MVQQEIINHNSQMEATNSSLNEMRDIIEKMDKAQRDVNNALGSEISNINIRAVQLSESVLSMCNKLVARCNDLEAMIQHNIESVMELTSAFEVQVERINSLQELYKIHHSKLVDQEKELARVKQGCAHEIEQSENRMLHSLERLKDHIENKPSEALEVEKRIMKLLSEKLVDFDGVFKELQVFKKKEHIVEKHVENLYTQIERLKSLSER